MTLQAEQVARLADTLPLPQLSLPFLFESDLGPAQVDVLAHDAAARHRRARPSWWPGPSREPRSSASSKRAADAAELAARSCVDQEVIVCTGSGGVGKTTTAAVIALEGARLGRRTCVVTIDPAKRLADALGPRGAVELAEPHRRAVARRALGADARHQEHLRRPGASRTPRRPSRPRASSANRFYRNISGALSGTQEYMAMEKLYELHDETDFDLVVVDTPPTRNALDFLEAPKRLTRFLDHRLYRVLMAPTRGVARAVNVAAQAFLRTVSKVVGGDVVRDAIAFFSAFDGMEAGFRDRAAATLALLSDDVTAFVLVAAPRGDVVDEATYFAARLHDAGIPVAGAGRQPDASPVLGRHAGFAARAGATPATAPTSAGSTPTWPTSPRWPPTRSSHLAGLAERVRAGAGGARAVPAAATCTTSTAWPRSAATSSRAATERARSSRSQTRRASCRPGGRVARAAPGSAASTVSVTGTMRSKPVVCSRRVRVGRLQATDTSPSASRARRMPPMSAPRPAESMKGTSDRSMSSRGLLASSTSDSRNWPTVYASSSPTGRHSV